jgi:hypothetical protein
VIVREFRVKAGCEKDFALVFGPGGVWAALVQTRSAGYVRTQLEAASVEDRRFRVLDYWQSHWDFEEFRENHQYDVEQFRGWLANKDLVEHEILVASFYTDELDEGDDAGLVLR